MHQPAAFPVYLTSDRLVLRPYAPPDAPGVIRMINANRDRLVENFQELVATADTPQAVSSGIETNGMRWNDCTAFVYGIWVDPKGDPVGQLTVKNITWNVPSAELSYFVDKRWARRGIATEAVRIMLHEAFERRKFRRMFVRVIDKNVESLALARRLGFAHEGMSHSAFRCGLGKLHDVQLFAITLPDDDSAAPG